MQIDTKLVTCPKCSAVNVAGSKNCKRCGQLLADPASNSSRTVLAVPAGPVEEVDKPKSRAGWLIAIALITLIVVGVIVVIALNLLPGGNSNNNSTSVAIVSRTTAAPSATTAVATTVPTKTPAPTSAPVIIPTATLPKTNATAITLLPSTPAMTTAATSPTVSPTLAPPTPDAARPGKNGKTVLEYTKLRLTVTYEPPISRTRVDQFVTDWQEAQSYVNLKLEAGDKGNYATNFELRYDGAPQPLGLGVRGFNDSANQTVYQLYDESGDRLDNQYITAHEMGHWVAFKLTGLVGHDLMVSEGLAMYASDEFLKRAGLVTIHDYATASLLAGRLLTIAQLTSPQATYNGRLVERAYYDQAGSFVSFLIETYGLDKFKAVYARANYQEVYGKNLGALSTEWTAFLKKRSETNPPKFDPAKYFASADAVIAAYKKLYADADANGGKLNPVAYKAIDTARIAAERHDYATAAAQLAIANQQLK